MKHPNIAISLNNRIYDTLYDEAYAVSMLPRAVSEEADRAVWAGASKERLIVWWSKHSVVQP